MINIIDVTDEAEKTRCVYCGSTNKVCQGCGYCHDHHELSVISLLESLPPNDARTLMEVVAKQGVAEIPEEVYQEVSIMYIWHTLKEMGYERKVIEDCVITMHEVAELMEKNDG